MQTHDAIKYVLKSSQQLLFRLIDDLTDKELLIRVVPGANHTAWQLGHLIVSEHDINRAILPDKVPALDADFTANHSRAQAGSDDAAHFCSKARYIDLYQAQREATLSILDGFNSDELDGPGPQPIRAFAPTIGAALIMQGTHTLMHLGQVTAVRRKLGKPVLM